MILHVLLRLQGNWILFSRWNSTSQSCFRRSGSGGVCVCVFQIHCKNSLSGCVTVYQFLNKILWLNTLSNSCLLLILVIIPCLIKFSHSETWKAVAYTVVSSTVGVVFHPAFPLLLASDYILFIPKWVSMLRNVCNYLDSSVLVQEGVIGIPCGE